MREILKHFNLRMVSEGSGVGYSVLRDYSCGRRQELKPEQEAAIKEYIKALTRVL